MGRAEARPSGAAREKACAPAAGVSEIFSLEAVNLFSKPHPTDKI
jgi:hypothetical protein